MVSTTFVAVLGALPLAFAQYYPSGNATVSDSPKPTGTEGSSAAQTVTVGNDGQLKFSPETITAKVGEQITFQFFPKNHAVAQSEFNNPCNPSDGGIFSGFIPSAAGPANKTFTITVKDEKPIWLYCPQNQPKPHCQQGMVAVINPPPSGPNTLDAYRQLAAGTNTSTAPSTPSGGEVGTPSNPASPSGTEPSKPSETPGAAANLAVSGGVLGFAALFVGLML